MHLHLARTLGKRAASDLVHLHDLWVGGSTPSTHGELVGHLRQRMVNSAAILAVLGKLDGTTQSVFNALLTKSGKATHFDAIRGLASRDGISATVVRTALAELVQNGLAANVSLRSGAHTSSLWGVPAELGQALQSVDASVAHPAELFTLNAWLTRHFRNQGGDSAAAQAQAQTMSRLLGTEASLISRIQALSEPLQAAFHTLAVSFGGILPIRELEKAGLGISANQLRAELENASLGTSGDLDLERFGIRQRGQVLTIFNEALLAYFKQISAQVKIEPVQTASIGVDFVSNFDRFANFVDDETVRFTVRGTIFKSTGKRLAERLLPNPGLEFGRLEILEMEYRFALAFRYIDRTGERSFRVTAAGQEFLSLPLAEKQRRMLDCLSEDRDMPGDVEHQLPMRRITLPILAHFPPSTWVDAMALPFLARNHYLATLGGQDGETHEGASFPVRASADLNSLAWNLFTWVRKHLYLLGFIDMGYDSNGRACSIQLTEMGAEFLGLLPATETSAAGHIVVNPDFELVFFPGDRAYELIYQLDRFADREKSDSLYHYRITPASLHRALSEGMNLDQILQLLSDLSRTPLPQNVEYSLESWARSDGMVTFCAKQSFLTCESAEILDRIALHPELGRLGLERVDRNTLKIRTKVESDPLSDWIRDYGVSVRVAS
jgi:XPB/Ssl2-like helicase family protein